MRRVGEALSADLGACIAFGRPFISNPDRGARRQAGAMPAAPDLSALPTPVEEGGADDATL